MPGLRDRLRTFRRRQRRPASPESNSKTSRPTSSNSSRPTPTQPEPDLKPTQPTSIISNLPAVPCAPADIEDIRRQIWNEAYDKVKDDERDTVDAYEKILSAQLAAGDADPSADRNPTNIIAENAEARQVQMKTLVEQGLDKTKEEARIKEKFNEGLRPVNNVKDFISIAMKSEPTAAVAWLGITTLMDLVANPLTEPGINRDGVRYVLERVEWYWELAQLLLDPGRVDDSIVGLQSPLRHHVIKLYKKLLLYQMQSVCLYNKHWAAVIVRDLFKGDDWQDKVASIKKAEASLRDDVDHFNSEELKSRLRRIDNTLGHLRLDVKAVESAIQDQTQQDEKRYQDDKYDKCMQDLHVTDPRKDKKRIQDTKGGLLRDSYRWILDHADFQSFRDDLQSRLLWIKGDPGKGKTMLLCGIIDELEKESNSLLSYFFCQATEAQLSNAASVLRGLIYLLILQQPSLISHVRSKHDVTGEKLFQGVNVWVSLVEILTGMLRDPTLKGAVLVVDALDECTIDRPQLLDFIVQSSSFSSHVKWIVSSRNWQDIEEKLGHTKRKVRLQLELNQDSISKAVDTYIGFKVDQLACEKKYGKETRDAVEGHLTSNADGTFLWVALVCQELADTKVVRKRHTLSKLKLFPSGLDPLYKRMIEQISDSSDAEICKEILAIASVVYRPITLEELKVLIESLEEDDYNDLPQIIKACGSFLTLREGVIYFVHQSAKDFLVDKASDQILPSGAAHQHHAIFSRSLEALSETLERDVYALGAPGFPTDQVSPPDTDPLASIGYSCVFWVDHLDDSEPRVKMSGRDLQDAGIIDDFLRKKYLYWLESLSLLRRMSEGVMAVQKLEALVKTKEARQLTEFLRDARRFILSHNWAIEIAPLQAYASALVFSPTRSLIRKLFEKEEPNWITLKPSMESDWNACLQTLEGHGGWVNSVVFSADSQRLASGSDDRTVKIWDAATGECVQTLEGHGGSVNSVVFSADGQRLASGSDDRTVKIWDAATGKCVQTLEGHGDWVNSVVFSADGQRLASGSDDRTVKIWDAATGKCVQTLEGHGDWVRSVVFSADGQCLASGSDDSTVKIWDAATGKCVQTLEGHGDWVRSVVFSADGQCLASGSGDRTVKIWDAATGKCVQTLEGHGDWVRSVVFSADGQRLASGSGDRTVKIWDAATGECVQTLEGHGGSVNSVVFSADGQRLASGSDDRTVKIWDAATGKCVQTLEGHGDWVNSVVFSADGQRLASGSDDSTVKIWDAATGKYVQTLEGHGDWVRSVVFSADGQRLASGSGDRTVKIWDAATGKCVQTLEGHGGSVNSVVFSADGQRLASGSGDRTVKIWDAATGECVQTLEGHGHSVNSVVFSADGQRLASGSDGWTVKIWDAAIGECVQTLEGHGGLVRSVVFSADGQRLASGSGDRTVKIWDAATGECMQTLNVGRALYHLSFDPTTNSLLSTDIGLLNLDHLALPPAIDDQSTEITLRGVRHSGWGISTDGVWIIKDRKEMLWLPPDYRGGELAVAGSTVAIGCRSGRVLVMKFS